MRLLLRKAIPNKSGEIEFNDIELAADTLTIGSAPDCALQLLGPDIRREHATLRLRNGSLQVSAARGNYFLHQDKKVSHAELAIGDRIAFGTHRLQVISTPAGFDAALEWQAGEIDGRYLAQAYRTSLRDTWLKPRLTAWILLLAVLLLGGAWPVFDYWQRQSAHETSAHVDSKAALAATAVAKNGGADTFWSAGPLHSAHRVAIGDRCEVCHAAPFQQVRDNACETCHQNMPEHVAKIHPEHAKFAEFRCRSCHEEHNQPSNLIAHDNTLCVNCHALREIAVSGFSQATHPAFRVSFPETTITRMQDNFTLATKIARQAMGPATKENSHLKFSHQQHLDAEKVQDQFTGKGLHCTDCHRLSSDKEHFEPITMQNSCIQCHDLGFDATQPQRQLPHGDVTALFETLDAHFIAKAYSQDQAVEERIRRLIPSHYTVYESCKGDLNCARGQARSEAERQFTKRGCVSCHEIEEFPQADFRLRWQIVPVKLVNDWYPSARFNHAVHLTRSGLEGDAVCTACHDAQRSQHSSDILIPTADNCLQCHDDAHGKQQVILQCVSCHDYHRSGDLRKEKPHAAL